MHFIAKITWTICENTNIFYLDSSDITDSTIIVDGDSTKKSCATTTNEAISFARK